MISGKTILCFASGYDAPPTSKHHVMHLLAEHNTVLWVNYHASRTPSASSSDLVYMARKLGQVFGGMRKVRENLYVLTPLVVPLPASPLARRINRGLIASRIRLALGAVRNGPLQIWSFTPDISYLLDDFSPERVVYYCVDDFAHFTGYDKAQVLADEEDLARRADLVVTTSLALQKSKGGWNPNTILVPHGVDYEHFSRAWREELPEPADMAGIPRPRLGFFGLIRDWVDVAMLAQIARRRPEWHFVLIGDATFDISRHAEPANMHFLGRRPYADLPAYCRYFDVGLIPFVVNELTHAVNPIKLREYLAAGLPVVSTPMPEVELYADHIHIASGPEAFETALTAALSETPTDHHRHRTAMADETWQEKVKALRTAPVSTEVRAKGPSVTGGKLREYETRPVPRKAVVKSPGATEPRRSASEVGEPQGLSVSVIMACLNAAQHIEEALESVFDQTYEHIELIVVDGASSDGTLDILERYIGAIDVLISERDGGIYDAMNKGLHVATGDVVFFLNADDRFADASVVSSVIPHFGSGNPTGIVYGDVMLERWNGLERRRFPISLTRKALAWGTVCHQALFTARRVFDETGPFSVDYEVASDFAWLLKAVIGCRVRAVRIDKTICVVGTKGLTYTKDWKHEKRTILLRHFSPTEVFFWHTCPRKLRPQIKAALKRATRAMAYCIKSFSHSRRGACAANKLSRTVTVDGRAGTNCGAQECPDTHHAGGRQ